MHKTTLELIEKQAAGLSLHEHIKLIEALVKQLREKSGSAQHGLDWAELYGVGRGLWTPDDAQDYINRLREDRI